MKDDTLHNIREEYNLRFNESFSDIAHMADKGDDVGYGKALARLQIDIGKFIESYGNAIKEETVNQIYNKMLLDDENLNKGHEFYDMGVKHQREWIINYAKENKIILTPKE